MNMPANASINLSSKIKGWGVDADTVNRPGVPRERQPINKTGVARPDVEQQDVTVRIHHSTERPGITPIFGTSCPPKLLSGLMRDFAYRYSEGRLIHWLTLLAAD